MFYNSLASTLHKGQGVQKEQDDESSSSLYCQELTLIEMLIKHLCEIF